MGRSSCLKIITCGSDSAASDDGELPENKSSRGWSFRKKSERHRVLSNTAIAETPSGHKEIPASVGLSFQPPDSSAAPKKTSTVEYNEEKPRSLSSVLAQDSDTTNGTDENHRDVKVEAVPKKTSAVEYIKEKPQSLPLVFVQESDPLSNGTDESHRDDKLEESVVIIQTAIRGFLARRDLLKRKNVVKLQAAVRGHLVRKHAVGSLRCVQAIVKMQALVRARRVRRSLEGSCMDGKPENDNLILKQEKSETKPNVTYTSIKSLLSNRFARQLMESTPKTKPINIKCDPSKPSSAWNWLERWMSVSVAEQSPKPEEVNDQPGAEKNERVPSPVDSRDSSEASSESPGSKSVIGETIVPSESEDNLITYDADKVKFEALQPTPFGNDNLQRPQLESSNTSDWKEASLETNADKDTSVEISSKRNQTVQSDANSEADISYPETENEQPKRSMKRLATDQLETEGKKYSFGSRKVSNPAFIAAHSKFEELSSSVNSGRSINSSNQDVKGELTEDAVSYGADIDSWKKEPSTIEPPVHNNSAAHHGGSECGTELSISSTLDSPDRFEVGTAECEQRGKLLAQQSIYYDTVEDLDDKSYHTSAIPLSNEYSSVTDQPEKVDNMIKSEKSDEAIGSQQVGQELPREKTTSSLPRELDSEAFQQASPRSPMTNMEPQGTPSSQVSSKSKKSKTGKKSNQKRKSLSAGKSPANDSGARSSVEQLPKDQKNGKRRSSFGSTKLESIDQEPRDSSSSNSLPRFMQATQSAKAKLTANNSPRSSPDLQDREIYIKKRHSLPGANGRQGSPRIQRSTSQAQQGANGNSTPPANERKWIR